MRITGLAAGVLAAAASSLIASPVGEIGPKRRQYRARGATANLSRNHPDYGMTVAQHEAAKAARLANQEQPQ